MISIHKINTKFFNKFIISLIYTPVKYFSNFYRVVEAEIKKRGAQFLW